MIAELLEAVHQPLMRTVALIEAAQEAPRQVRDRLHESVEEIEQQLSESMGAKIRQMDWLALAEGKQPPLSNTGVRLEKKRDEGHG